MKLTMIAGAFLCLVLATFAGAQSTYPNQNHPTQPQPSSPCAENAPCPPPAASQPDTPAPPPTEKAPRSGTPSGLSPAGSRTVTAGTALSAKLDTQLSARTTHPGDAFTATVDKPVAGPDGSIAIPAGSKIHGEVLEPKGATPETPGASGLKLRFTTISLPDGASAPLHATMATDSNDHEGADKTELPANASLRLRLDQNLTLPERQQ